MFSLQEAKTLFVDVELLNKQNVESGWKASIQVLLYWFDGEKGVCIAQKPGNIELHKDDEIVRYNEVITAKDLNGFQLREGVYRVLVEIGGVQGSSEDLFFMEGRAQVSEYCRVLDAGIDRCCDETQAEGEARVHSYKVLNQAGLKDVRFYMLAQNLLEKEWVYEFVIRVLSGNGDTKLLRRVVSGQYMKTPSGNCIYFVVDLSDERSGFWTAGSYTIMVSGFDQLMFTLPFNIGR